MSKKDFKKSDIEELTQKFNLLRKAAEICFVAHKDQKRKFKIGLPYAIHPVRVVLLLMLVGCRDEEILSAALLHDVLEDTYFEREDLEFFGFPKEILDSVEILTKKPEETYLNYILRCSTDKNAKMVKLADLKHNLSDLSYGSMRDKYLLAKYILENKK